MRDFIQILKRFIPPYKSRLGKNIFYNILSAAFGSVSFVLLVPVLNILFNVTEEVTELVPFELNKESLMTNFNYYVTLSKQHFSASTTLLFAGGFFVLAALFKTGFSYLASYEIVFIRNGVVRDIRRKIYQKILSLPLPFFSEERKGDIIARTTGDVQEVENSIMNSLEMFFQNPIIILIYLSGMIFMSWQLTLFVLVLLPIMGTLIGKVGKTLKKRSKEGQDKMGEILSNIEETLSGLRVIKAFNAEDKMDKLFTSHNEQYRQIMNRLMWRRSLAHPMSEFLGTIVVVIVVWFGGLLILGQTSHGRFKLHRLHRPLLLDHQPGKTILHGTIQHPERSRRHGPYRPDTKCRINHTGTRTTETVKRIQQRNRIPQREFCLPSGPHCPKGRECQNRKRTDRCPRRTIRLREEYLCRSPAPFLRRDQG